MDTNKSESPAGNYARRFEILRRLALSGAAGDDLTASVENALEGACALLELSAGRIILFSETGESALNVGYAVSDSEKAVLDELESDLFETLRRKRNLRSAYVTFGGDNPLSAFTLPLQRKGVVFGAALGTKPGHGKLSDEDEFLESLAAAIAMTVVVDSSDSFEAPGARRAVREEIDRARLKAVMETAVTVNHEINNPLTAALGNVQLILMQSDNLDPDIRRKLEIVEKSAMQIRDVTQRLLSLKVARSIPYAGKETMIDIGPEISADDSGQTDSDNPPRTPRRKR
ncbi:MAG: hypothetical protein IH914_03670 [candidate division Zixibacteria bacterium]|nr:hypothetical protein [candidate division Zixibacteria bacterium]